MLIRYRLPPIILFASPWLLFFFDGIGRSSLQIKLCGNPPQPASLSVSIISCHQSKVQEIVLSFSAGDIFMKDITQAASN
jgi:hypothetical protein